MDSWHVLRHIHRIGTPISGTVTVRDKPDMSWESPQGRLTLKTTSPFRALLPFDQLVDEPSSLSPEIIPQIGDSVSAVVFNFVDDTLYLSARPHDLKDTTIARWQEYYDYIDTLAIGSKIKGIVTHVRPFGIFVDIGGPFVGLIDIGHTEFNGGTRISYDHTEWPKAGDEIYCNVGYFRLHGQQIGLGWSPPNEE